MWSTIVLFSNDKKINAYVSNMAKEQTPLTIGFSIVYLDTVRLAL